MELPQIIQSIKNVLVATLRDHPDDQNLLIAIGICKDCRIEMDDNVRLNLDEPTCRAWNEVIPKQVCEHSQPAGLHKGTLFINVDSSLWLTEIVRYHRQEFLTLIQARLGADIVRRISYRHIERGPVFLFHLPSQLFGISQVKREPGEFGNARECIWLALQHVLKEKPFTIRFYEIDMPEEDLEPSTLPQAEHSVELHLEMLQSDLEKVLMPFDVKSTQGETLHGLALSLSDRFRKVGNRWWAGFKRAEERKDPRSGELRALSNFWYLLANSCDAIVGPVSDEERQIAANLSRLQFDHKTLPTLTFQAAEMQLEATKLAVIVVKPHIIASEDEAQLFKAHFTDFFDGAHIVLAAQLADGIHYYGRTDTVKRLAKMNPEQLPWREYPLSRE